MIDDIINSCRVCRSSNQDGEFESLFVDDRKHEVTTCGQLYEELLFSIEADTVDFYPKYLCNSCELQMRLFKKLKIKANKTLEALVQKYSIDLEAPINVHTPRVKSTVKLEFEINGELYGEQYLDIMAETKSVNTMQHNEPLEEPLESTLFVERLDNIEEELIQEVQIEEDLHSLHDNDALNGQETNINETKTPDYEPIAVAYEALTQDVGNKSLEVYEYEINANNTKRDEMSELTEYIDVVPEPIEEQEEVTDNKSVYLEVDYLDDNVEQNVNQEKRIRPKQKTFGCRACALSFDKRAEYIAHRKLIHSNKHPCKECGKHYKTGYALRVHMKIHDGSFAYQCELCDKKFIQKVHYKYHMDKHNNIRNYKCTECGKAFLSKADINVHTRSHTGERKFVCQICGKDFMIYQHLKMHKFSHGSRKFECEFCKLQFTTPVTLHTHIRSIHSDREPEFQCELCAKKFRRKHHLITHRKVHQKFNTDEFYDVMQQIEERVDNDFLEIVDENQIDGIHIIYDEEGVADDIDQHIDAILT